MYNREYARNTFLPDFLYRWEEAFFGGIGVVGSTQTFPYLFVWYDERSTQEVWCEFVQNISNWTSGPYGVAPAAAGRLPKK